MDTNSDHAMNAFHPHALSLSFSHRYQSPRTNAYLRAEYKSLFYLKKKKKILYTF